MTHFRIADRTSSLVALALLANVAACSNASNEEITQDQSDLTGHIPGKSISSPNASPTATYLSARRIDTLTQVGALPGVLAGLAGRVDGIIANQPADGRFSVTELLQIEKPGFIETLFPEERAALPGLWALLETTEKAPTPVTAPAPAPFEAVDISTPAGAPIKPAHLAVSSLDATTQTSAQRLELTHDDDRDKTTVAESDLNAAISSPGPYTPNDIQNFRDILTQFLARAGTTLSAKVRVSKPQATTTTLATFGGATGGATFSVSESLDYTETRDSTLFSSSGNAGGIDAYIYAHHIWQPSVALGANQSLVVIDETTEGESVHQAGAFEVPTAGTATLEVWSGGKRLGSYRANLPALTQIDEKKDLAAYADYTFVASGKPLIRSVLSATQTYQSWWNKWTGSESSTTNTAAFTYDVDPKAATGDVNPAGLAGVATPGLPVPAGRYEVSAGSAGLVDIDLYPEGVVRITRPSGETIRARLYRWEPSTKWDAEFPDRFRVLIDPSGNTQIFFDGQSTLFSAGLTGAQRKG